MAFDQRLRVEYIDIHHALHDLPYINTVRLTGKDYPITLSDTGLRQVIYRNLVFIQQNPYKRSAHAKAAREGKKITWALVPDGPWIYIDDKIASDFKLAVAATK